MGANKPIRPRNCTSAPAKSSLGPSERPKIVPERVCSNGKMQQKGAQQRDLFKSGCEQAFQGEKVRVGGAVGALMPEFPGPSSRILIEIGMDFSEARGAK